MFKNNMQLLLLKSVSFLIKILKIAGILLIIFLLMSFGMHFIDTPEKYPTLIKINTLTNYICTPIIEQIKMLTPYSFNNVDYSPIILIVIVFIIIHILTLIERKLKKKKHRLNEQLRYQEWRNRVTAVLPREKIVEMDKKFEALNSNSNVLDRKKMLKEFAMLKNKLDQMGQHLAFLSIDVVDSTGMKRDEDKYLAAYDFDRYNELVITCLKEHRVIKYAMTPDGMMSCFRSMDDAVNAGKSLIEKLQDFNKNTKQIQRDFHIRCGINGGFVYIADDIPLEQVSDRAIDIAGHMQKHARPDTINIAASAIEPLKNRDGFAETHNIIDEQRVYEWNQESDQPIE